MPTTYAHDLFGKMVSKKLNEELKTVIAKHKTAFSIGLHGPDILFYVRPFQKNRINELGERMHREAAADFFKRGKERYTKEHDPELLSYLCGFVCHFMLDSNCHPYISTYMEKMNVSHARIETEFDRALMEQTGKNPFRYHPSSVIHLEKSSLETIAAALGLTPKDVKSALRSMKFYTGATVCTNSVKRKTLLYLAKICRISNLVGDRVIRKTPPKNCVQSNLELKRLFKLAIPETVTVLEEFYREIEDTGNVSPRFNRNYNG